MIVLEFDGAADVFAGHDGSRCDRPGEEPRR